MIVLERVSLGLPGFSLREVSFRVAEGGCYCLMGPSGSGKTVLLDLVAGFYTPDSGSVRIRGVDASGIPPESRRIGLVYQDYSLFPHMTGAGNVAFGLRVSGMPAARAAREAEDLLAALGVPHLSGNYPGTMSGGERQRCALARALAVSPDILLLDEPFSALDPAARAGCLGVVRALAEERNLTMLLVSHSREEASALADRAGLIIGGRIVQEGTVAEIFARPETVEAALYSGVENIVRGEIDEASGGRIVVRSGALRIAVTGQGLPGQAVTCGIRARDIRLYRERSEGAGGNIVAGTVTGSYRTGDRTVVLIGGDTNLRAEVPGDRQFRAGSTVHAAFDPGDVLVYAE